MSFKNFILGLGIVIIFALALWQGIQAFYPSPEYGDYCTYRYENIPKQEAISCPVVSNELQNQANDCYNMKGEFRYEYDGLGCISGGYCDDCSINYNSDREIYSRNIFIISFVVGFITFVLGLTLLKVEPVGSALLGSGIWAVFYGTMWNWENFGAGIRFVLLLIALVVLVWFALRINSQSKKSFFDFGKKKK